MHERSLTPLPPTYALARAHLTDVVVSSTRSGAKARPRVYAGDGGSDGTILRPPTRPREVGLLEPTTARSTVAGKS